ncbi:hypothetical protein RD055328_10860 [Companilactobacillus sp. RD055328]|uniref:peptidoglycan recognition protein family protein n=1 Tax=Companilactobacillus sp. RD055328 TaxID=2916634 RepID=UPI001FC84235|nr:peptidoglycan recognition family protein [Companilactobacillus sp. RD055328]GKQ43163.1 hypothetical protein RD055328_10860 [Companilactobacillus sp. RD055328]
MIKKNIGKFGIVLSTIILLILGAKDVTANSILNKNTLTPSEMKSGLSEKEIKNATPKEDKGTNTDDIGMPIKKSDKKRSQKADSKKYPDVNNYILTHDYTPPNITYDLHQFEMFNYGTDDNRPTGVVVHYTANPNNYSARSEADYQINGGWKSAFVHTFIDAGSILNIHDTDYGAWGCGPVGNNYFTQFEMVTARNYNDFVKTTNYSAWYTAYLLKKYDLTPSLAQANGGKGTIWSHHNVTQYLGGTDHTDPDAYFAKYGYDMSQFLELVKHYYNEMPANRGDLNKGDIINGNLHVNGWHASQESEGRPYSFLFLLDAKTHTEVKRIKISRTQRDDVQSAFPNISNSGQSGFDNDFEITKDMYGKKYILMSRYSSDPNGNINNIDYTYRNILTMPTQKNIGSLDEIKSNKNSLSVGGWHISNDSRNKPYSYLFLLDAKTHAEVKRSKISRTQRNDVYNGYKDVFNSLNSGFDNSFKLEENMYDKKYVLMSRYSSDPNGNTDVVDYIFDKVIETPETPTKASSLDHLISTKTNIHIDGWQADNKSLNKPYSYVILLDTASGREYKRFKINREQRPDVQAAYPEIYNSLNSGFKLDIPIIDEMRGHTYKFLVRYSSDISGNGDNADVTFGSAVNIPNWETGNYGDLNELYINNNAIHARGWHASSDSKSHPYSYLFLLDANTYSEIKRVKINRTQRIDVGSAYPNIINSEQSGFENDFKIDNTMYGKNVVVMSRYSSTPDGNGDNIDYISSKQLTIKAPKTNEASLDHLEITKNNIHLDGWQADNNSINKPYSYVILLDTATGREYSRFKISRVQRPDVQAAYPELYNSLNSGFNLDIPITDEMRGHSFKLLVRYSTDVTGNGDNADVVFDNVANI